MRVSRTLPTGVIACKQLPPGERIPWHDHGKPTLCVVYAGQVEEQDRQRTRVRVPGDLVFRPEPEPHRNRVPGTPVRILTLELAPDAMPALVDLGFPDGRPVHRPTLRASVLARAAEAALLGDDDTSGLELSALTFELLAIASREARRAPSLPPRWLHRIRDRLYADLTTRHTLASLAVPEGVSPDQVAREFRRHYGQSVAEFLRTARIERALALLADTDMPLLDVALEVGFYDQSHLTNVVGQRVGLTPATYRRQVRSRWK